MVKRVLIYLAKVAVEGAAWDVLIMCGSLTLARWANMGELHPSVVVTVFLGSLASLLVMATYTPYLIGRLAAWLLPKVENVATQDARDPVVLVYRPSFQVPPPYSENWNYVQEFTFWQIAWLLAGREPVPRVPPGTLAYPFYRMLKADYGAGELQARQNDPSKGIGYFVTGRKELERYVSAKNIQPLPSFLFD